MSDNLPFIDVRVIFAKTGSALWFSHLDLNRAVSRALRRSKLDIWMTQGFTPRPHIVFSPPLSLGYESEGEIMEFRLNLGATLSEDALYDVFPPCLPIKDIYFPKTKLKEIAYADYRITFDSDAAPDMVTELFSKPLEMVKKTKRSEQTVDITPFINRLECKKTDSGLEIDTTLTLNNQQSLSPSYILEAMKQNGIRVEYPAVCRKGFRDINLNIFK